MKTLDELDRLHAAATAAVAHIGAVWQAKAACELDMGPALYHAWPSFSARLRAAEAVLRALVACDDAIAAGRVPPTSRHDLAAKARAALGES